MHSLVKKILFLRPLYISAPPCNPASAISNGRIALRVQENRQAEQWTLLNQRSAGIVQGDIHVSQ